MSLLQLCLYNETTGAAISLGRYRGGPDWYINSFDPLNYTITYYDGDIISSAQLYVHAFCNCVFCNLRSMHSSQCTYLSLTEIIMQSWYESTF